MRNTPPHTPNQTPPSTPPNTSTPNAPPVLQRKSTTGFTQRVGQQVQPASLLLNDQAIDTSSPVSTPESSEPNPLRRRVVPAAGTAPTPSPGPRRALVFTDPVQTGIITGADVARIFNERPAGGQNCGSGSKRHYSDL